MPSINKCFILTSLVLSALTLATPHGLLNVGQRRIAAEGLLAIRHGDNDCNAPSSTPTPTPVALAASPKATSSSSSTTPSPSAGTSPSSASSSSSGTHTGEGTYYGTGLGACGVTSNDSQYIVAMSKLLFDTYPGYNGANPNTNPICGKQLTAHYQGKSVTCTIVDRCEACAYNDLDFSPAAFSVLADQAVGRIYGVTWSYD